MHSPGPWHIKFRVNVFDSRDRLVASTGGFTTNTDNGEHMLENEANALLIVAVPEMLGALEEIASGPCCQSPGCNLDEPQCDSMIARAALHRKEG